MCVVGVTVSLSLSLRVYLSELFFVPDSHLVLLVQKVLLPQSWQRAFFHLCGSRVNPLVGPLSVVLL